MPLVDPVLVLADHGTADFSAARRSMPRQSMTQATRELLTVARQLGTPVTVPRSRYPEPDALAALVRELRPLAVLFPADRLGEQAAARLAVRLESGIVTDVVGVSRDHGTLFVVQEAAGGTCRIATELRGPTPIITVRRGAFPAERNVADIEDAGDMAGEIRALRHPDTSHTDGGPDGPAPRAREVGRRHRGDAGRDLLLAEADVVVAGGRGVGSAEGFSLLARVAQALGGRLGGTHTAGELGWCPDHARISLPGAQIRPRLYLAGGVSGSLRHRAAIRRARTVVAIDRDPAAPIFREADFGIVGDLHEVLPALLEELARRPGRGERATHGERAGRAGHAEQQEQSGRSGRSEPAEA